ncbi:hypothetical protein U875_26260 [Pandoraea pnomenusa 3kgm]|nr:hypothetical protein U875_26260 [Pandoraea pnomenusa 3kgm]
MGHFGDRMGPDVCPVDPVIEILTMHCPAGQVFDLRAMLSRDAAPLLLPLKDRRTSYPERVGQTLCAQVRRLQRSIQRMIHVDTLRS